MIEITELTKYYGERKAVGPLSCSIQTGEIVGLLGLNGAGKTTTLRILACDLLPSSGSVMVDGLDVVESPAEIRSRIGYLPDHPPLYPEMTVREFLLFAAELRGMSGDAAKRRVPEVERITQIDHVSNDVIGSLSHGYKQRVGIAQAIVHKPRLLVLDEPITGLDPVQIVEMRELLKSLRGEHTILLSSHILSEISETCDRILVIRDGQIGAQGTEAELSSQLLQVTRIDVTVRGDGASATKVLEAVDGVREVEKLSVAGLPYRALMPTAADETTFRVEAERDVRADLVRALVEAKVDVLGVGRGERELENVFLRLAGPAGSSSTNGQTDEAEAQS